MTIAATVAAIKALPGMTARQTLGEWRVTYTQAAITEREGVTGRERDERAESLACYTNDATDALDTARAMSLAWYGEKPPVMVNPEIVSEPAPTLALAAITPDAARLAIATLDSPPADTSRDGIKTDGEGRQYIDMTPTWGEILPTLLAIVTDGDAKGRAFAREELARMAGLADRFTAARKAFAAVAA